MHHFRSSFLTTSTLSYQKLRYKPNISSTTDIRIRIAMPESQNPKTGSTGASDPRKDEPRQDKPRQRRSSQGRQNLQSSLRTTSALPHQNIRHDSASTSARKYLNLKSDASGQRAQDRKRRGRGPFQNHAKSPPKEDLVQETVSMAVVPLLQVHS